MCGSGGEARSAPPGGAGPSALASRQVATRPRGLQILQPRSVPNLEPAMVGISALLLPILLSAVIVFVASSLLHIVLTYHRSDYQKLPNEDAVGAAIRAGNAAPGQYLIPHMSMTEMRSAEGIEKFKKGPVAMLFVRQSGAPGMGKNLVQWFVYSVVIGVFVAYVTGRTLGAG